MDLLERYLQAVKFFLPRRQQDDIIRELSENLLSQMEDREEALGRALSEDEQADILRRHGHPMLVAGRYRSHQQLVGPAFFPLYLFALKAGLATVVLVTIVVATITTVLNGDPVRQGVAALLALPGRALMMFAWTTLGFAALDFARARLKLAHKWDPRSLPKVVRQADRVPRVRSMCEFVLGTAGTVWLLLVPWAPSLLLGPAAAVLEPTPIGRLVYVPILLLSAAGAAHSFINFTRPYRTPARSLVRAAIHGGNFLVAAFLLRSGDLVAARSGATLPGDVPLFRGRRHGQFWFSHWLPRRVHRQRRRNRPGGVSCMVRAVDIFVRFGGRATRERRVGLDRVRSTRGDSTTAEALLDRPIGMLAADRYALN